jgi:hypothetical protein
VQVLQV